MTNEHLESLKRLALAIADAIPPEMLDEVRRERAALREIDGNLTYSALANETDAKEWAKVAPGATAVKVRIVPEGATCEWAHDGEGNYDTACGQRFTIIDGLPGANGMKFCCYCGSRIGADAEALKGRLDDTEAIRLGIHPRGQ